MPFRTSFSKPVKFRKFRTKNLLPKSLFGRALLIIVLPIIIMQMVVAYIFFNAHWQTVTSHLSNSIAADISVAVELYQQAPSLEHAQTLDNMLRPNMELSIALEMGDQLPTTTRNAFFSNLDRTLRRALDQSLQDPFWFDTTRYPNHIDIRVGVEQGVLRFIAPRERVFAPTGFMFIFWSTAATVLLTLVSIFFIRNQARPISKLAAAAEAFGKGQGISNFRPSGASEVRLAGQSFLKMHHRIRRYIDQRTLLLAGVSHDLRTPLTRLKLHLAMQADNEEVQAAKRDLKDMETMLDGYLDFARGIGEETTEIVNIRDYIQHILDEYDAPTPTLNIDESILQFDVKTVSLKRAFTNLIDNARKYATEVRINVTRDETMIYIHIEDNGPGIPQDKYIEALRPFQRLDTARNQNIKGTGLGLSITRDIIQSHGGSMRLDKSDLGGLKVVLRLPI